MRDGFTVLFGYSGAGKSLTLGMIAGTLRPDAGRVVLGNATLCDTTAGIWVPPQQRRIGYVSQAAQLFPHMTVQGNVEYALKGLARTQRRARAAELLDRLHVADLAMKRPHQLSGGQKQRCALARGLALEPQAMLLDEPLSALDLPFRVEMRELLREVQRDSGVPFVMVTHDLYEACALADTLVVYSGIGAVQVGSPEELVGDPATPEIRRLLHAMQLPESVFDQRHAAHLVPLNRKEHVA
ncbi:MAG: ABC transporter ATP-binding protein [Coriobacteriia bacterium]|nr:ABC transporter ATP-binding protein [Coriobacteriia bacterium]